MVGILISHNAFRFRGQPTAHFLFLKWRQKDFFKFLHYLHAFFRLKKRKNDNQNICVWVRFLISPCFFCYNNILFYLKFATLRVIMPHLDQFSNSVPFRTLCPVSEKMSQVGNYFLCRLLCLMSEIVSHFGPNDSILTICLMSDIMSRI